MEFKRFFYKYVIKRTFVHKSEVKQEKQNNANSFGKKVFAVLSLFCNFLDISYNGFKNIPIDRLFIKT